MIRSLDWLLSVIILIVFTFKSVSFGQRVVEVRDEPFHRPVFQNKHIRLLDVIIPPGDTSLYHRHYLPSAFVFLEQTDIGMQDLGANPGQLITTLGQTWFNGYEKGAQIHRAWTNDKKIILHAIDIEILDFDPADADKSLNHPAVELLSESAPLRIYRVKISGNEKTTLQLNNNPVVIIPYTGDIKLGKTVLKRSSYIWWNKRSVQINAEKNEEVLCYLYEIRT